MNSDPIPKQIEKSSHFKLQIQKGVIFFKESVPLQASEHTILSFFFCLRITLFLHFLNIFTIYTVCTCNPYKILAHAVYTDTDDFATYNFDYIMKRPPSRASIYIP